MNQLFVYRNMWFISVPIVLQLVFLSISTTVDAIMLSFLNQDSMSAASLVGSLAGILDAAIIAFTTAMTSTFGKYWGQRDFESAAGLFAHVLKLSLIVSLVFCIASLFFPRQIMTVFTDVPQIQDHASSFLPDEILVDWKLGYFVNTWSYECRCS